MKKVLGALALTALFAVPASAGVWEAKCEMCHKGPKPPSKEQLKTTYKTAEQFIKAGVAKLNSMFGVTEQQIKAAAKELYK